MKIVLLILAILGLLKVISLIIFLAIEAKYKASNKQIDGLKKHYGFYADDSFYLIPTIRFCKNSHYFEVMIEWLWFQYYSSYSIDKTSNEE